jgi:multiple antibiotic resistance protein
MLPTPEFGLSAFGFAAVHAPTTAVSVAQSIEMSRIFTLFFLMLGPIKVVVPFARHTTDSEPAARRKLALTASALSVISLAIVASIGVAILRKWHISLPALTMTAGIILFLVALQLVMKQYSPPSPVETESPPPRSWVMSPLAFPTIITPYGIAVLILLISEGGGVERQLEIFGLALAVIAMDLLAMLYAHGILKLVGTATLQLLGVVLGVLQVALGLELIILALTQLGIAHPIG